MSRAAAALLTIVLLGGCGEGAGNSTSPKQPAPVPEAGAADRACADAKRTVHAIYQPKYGLVALIDYTDQAADALEKVRSPAVKPLRAIDLAAADSGADGWLALRRLNRAARRLARVDGDCGERQARKVAGAVVYAFNLSEALRLDKKRYRRNKRAGGDFVSAVRNDARRAEVLARRMKAAPVPPVLKAQHRRFLATHRSLAERYRAAGRNPAAVSDAELDRVWDASVQALKALNRAIRAATASRAS